MIDFVVPSLSQNIRDLELEQLNENNIKVNNVTDLSALDKNIQLKHINSLDDALQECSNFYELICNNQSFFDGVYSGVRFFKSLEKNLQQDMIQLLCDMLVSVTRSINDLEKLQVDDSLAHEIKVSLKISVYFLAKLCIQEKDLSISEKDQILCCLLGSIKSTHIKRNGDDNNVNKFDIPFKKLWKLGLPEESFLDLYWRTAEYIVLVHPRLSTTIYQNLVELICLPAHYFHKTISHLLAASFSHSLRKHDNVPAFFCDVLVSLCEKYNDERLAREMIFEISRLDTHEASRDISGIKRLGNFIESLSKDLPSLALSNLSILMPYIEAEAYPLRCSIIRALGSLVTHLKSSVSESIAFDSVSPHDKDATKTNMASIQDTRDQLIDLLGERCHDTSSYVRSTALCVFSELSRNQVLPISYIHVVCDFATERLLDKSSLVRKQAISCLTVFMENNPYNDSLDPRYFKDKLAKLEENKLKSDKQKLSLKDQSNNEEDESKSESEQAEIIQEQQNPKDLAALMYYKSALGFTVRMEYACVRVEKLTKSKSTSDVLEGMRFLSAALRFKLPTAKGCMRRTLLALIWDDRESGKIKKELLLTFELIYISEPQEDVKNGRALYPEHQIVNNLIEIVLDSTLSELTSLEHIIGELVNTEGTLKRLGLPSLIVQKIWGLVIEESSPIQKRQAAMCIIAMVASVSNGFLNKLNCTPTKVYQHVLLCKNLDYKLARYAFSTLNKIYSNKKTIISPELKGNIEKVIRELLLNEQSWKEEIKNVNNLNCWFPAAEQALRLLFKCSDRPDLFCASVIRTFHKKLFCNNAEGKISQKLLSQFFFLLGQVSIQIFVYCEERGNLAKQIRKGMNSKSKDSKNNDDNILKELGADENAQDDFEESIVKRIADEELVTLKADTLLGLYIPLLVSVIEKSLLDNNQNQEENGISEENLKDGIVNTKAKCILVESATLALCKMMCINKHICEKYLSLILTLLRDSEDENVRSNIMIAMGDLAVRFPNIIEPFTKQIYRRLRDHNQGVRKTSLMVLSHLILNDMIKVRGEVSELALCIIDDKNERIRDLSELFFHELSRKGNNPIYNLLPDAINKISRDPTIEVNNFRKIAIFLMKFITLEKHSISIMEKFCQRIFTATGLTKGAEEASSILDIQDLKLCRDLSFCLSQLKMSDKAILKLTDQTLFKLYKPVLADSEVNDNFKMILRRAKQHTKPETKLILDEWAKNIDEVRKIHIENHESTSKASKLGRKGKKSKKSVIHDINEFNKENAINELNSI